MSIEELEKKEAELWAEVQRFGQLKSAAELAWNPVYAKLKDAKLRAECEAKIRKEMANEH